MSDYDYYDLSTGDGLMESELYERYDDMIDEIHGEPMGYPASRILKEVDPTAYRVGFSDWISMELGETLTDDKSEDENEDEEVSP